MDGKKKRLWEENGRNEKDERRFKNEDWWNGKGDKRRFRKKVKERKNDRGRKNSIWGNRRWDKKYKEMDEEKEEKGGMENVERKGWNKLC